jgi:hypothetical protein
MSYRSRVYRQRNANTPENSEKKEPFFNPRRKMENPENSMVISRKEDKRATTQKKFDIQIEKGDKDWKPSELELLYGALGRLSDAEGKVLRKYRFMRWSNKANRAAIDKDYIDPGSTECGLHEMDLKKKLFRISIYDECFKDPQATSQSIAGIDPGMFHILHEIGHATEKAEVRNKTEAYKEGNKKYNEAVDAYNKAGAADQKKLKPAAEKLEKDDARKEKEMNQAPGSSLKEFEKFVTGKEPLTEYSKENMQEAYAEAFAIYKADPKGLEKINKKLYDWFKGGGYFNTVPKK